MLVIQVYIDGVQTKFKAATASTGTTPVERGYGLTKTYDNTTGTIGDYVGKNQNGTYIVIPNGMSEKEGLGSGLAIVAGGELGDKLDGTETVVLSKLEKTIPATEEKPAPEEQPSAE
jgi:hypothetical protein